MRDLFSHQSGRPSYKSSVLSPLETCFAPVVTSPFRCILRKALRAYFKNVNSGICAPKQHFSGCLPALRSVSTNCSSYRCFYRCFLKTKATTKNFSPFGSKVVMKVSKRLHSRSACHKAQVFSVFIYKGLCNILQLTGRCTLVLPGDACLRPF